MDYSVFSSVDLGLILGLMILMRVRARIQGAVVDSSGWLTRMVLHAIKPISAISNRSITSLRFLDSSPSDPINNYG